MIGTIKVADAMRLASANSSSYLHIEDIAAQTRSDESYSETLESIRRYGVINPILIRYEEVCNGTHRVVASFDLGLEEIPFTDDPEIGWANEFEWPEEKEAMNCE